MSSERKVKVEIVTTHALAPVSSSIPTEADVDRLLGVLENQDSMPTPRPSRKPTPRTNRAPTPRPGAHRAPTPQPDRAPTPPPVERSVVEEEPQLLDLGFIDSPAVDESAEAGPSNGTAQESRTPTNLQERIRGLSSAEQQRLSRTGEQRERVVLERMYGKNVWPALLRNPKLTAPEVARIARMGALPAPLLELIANNRAWLSSAQVRRALLTNPRLKQTMIVTVLRATPKNELKLMPKQMAYPIHVRQAARKLLK